MNPRSNFHTLAVTALLAIGGFATQAADNEPTNSLAIQTPDQAETSAGGKPLPWEKASISLGGFIAAFNDNLGFGVNGIGATVNPEKLLGLDSTLYVFRAGALYRPGKTLRNQLDFTYAAYDRSGSGALSQELNLGGTTYPVGAEFHSHFNFDLIRGTYSRAILQDERMRIALGFTLYAVPIDFGLDVQTSGGLKSVGGANITLPLPALALRSEFLLVPKLFLNASIDAMYFEMSNFKGSLLDVNVGLEYRPWKHFGFGLDFNALSLYAEAQGSSSGYPGADFIGSVDARYSGMMLYVKIPF